MDIPKPNQELGFDKASALNLILAKQAIFKDIADADEIKDGDAGEIKNPILDSVWVYIKY